MSFLFAALALTAVMFFAMGFFLLGTPPLLLLKYDVPNDARFVRGLFNSYFIAVALTAALAGASYALAGQMAFSAGMGFIAVFAVLVRGFILRRMDTLRATMQPSDSAAIAQFRRLHVGGMLLNGVQFGAVACGLTQLAT